jgi:hypothetical protein
LNQPSQIIDTAPPGGGGGAKTGKAGAVQTSTLKVVKVDAASLKGHYSQIIALLMAKGRGY